MNVEQIRKALSGMYMSAYGVALATDSPRAATAAMRGLARLNRLHFEPEPNRDGGIRVVEELDDGTRRDVHGGTV